MTTSARLQRIESTVNAIAQRVAVPRLALTRAEAAAALGVSEDSIDRLSARGLLRPSRALGRPVYPIAELERMLRETTA